MTTGQQGRLPLNGVPTFFPPDLNRPVFLGAPRGHFPITMHCGRCGYRGDSNLRCATTRADVDADADGVQES